MTMPNENAPTSTVMNPTSISSMTSISPTSPQYRTLSPVDTTSDQLITKPSYAAVVATLPPNDTLMQSTRHFDNINTNSMSSGHENSRNSSNISFNVRFTTMKPCKCASGHCIGSVDMTKQQFSSLSRFLCLNGRKLKQSLIHKLIKNFRNTHHPSLCCYAHLHLCQCASHCGIINHFISSLSYFPHHPSLFIIGISRDE